MFRDMKIFRRNYGKNHTADGSNENLLVDATVSSSSSQPEADPSRPPFNPIQDPAQKPKSGLDHENVYTRKNEKTLFKSHVRGSDPFSQLVTPEKSAAAQNRFGWIPKSELPESSEELLHLGQFQLPPAPPPIMGNHALNFGNGGGYFAATPRAVKTAGKASSVHSGTSSTQSTPTKSITKLMLNGVSSSRAPQFGGTTRAMNFMVPSKGMPISSAPLQLYSPAEVPHFELKEDPSFWMDHNVQEMLFRVAGLPMVENCMSGYNSCVFAYGQIREDLRKGVHVENLKEFEVENVNDIVKLLIQEELSMLKSENVSRSLSIRAATLATAEYDDYSPSQLPGILPNFNQMHANQEFCSARVSDRKEEEASALRRREEEVPTMGSGGSRVAG
ncbi:Kinesin-like protein KIN12A [Platanthera zijinensis]|uniref:Kinesin-like protein KIN12A n=1 Tax=Platanthera zijinensis TaxID=2320716 RepID=A0AAP0GF20_9ASPA